MGISFEPANYQLTSANYQWNSNWNEKCKQEYGADAEVGDWNDLESAYNVMGSDWRTWLNDLGWSGSYFLERGGQQYHTSGRAYFGTLHEGDVPGYYAVHDDIDSNWMSLGSWDSTNGIFCYVPQKAPERPTNLKPESENASLNPNISANYNHPDGYSGRLYFETKSGEDIGNCSVEDGSSCSVKYSSADEYLISYQFSAYAVDKNGRISKNSTQRFTPSISICDSRGVFGKCISTSFHNISGQNYSLNNILESKNNSKFISNLGISNILITNRTVLSGQWIGSINISTKNENPPVLKSGLELRPNGKRILIN